MTGKQHILKHLLFAGLLLGIALPMVQHLTGIKYVEPLKGAVVLAEPGNLSDSSWLNGQFQDQTDKYLNDQFGFRPHFVRLHNQLKYSMYGDINANGVIIGKEGYMYEWNYIRSYYGLDFIGDSLIRDKSNKIRAVQDSLKARGKTLLVILAPGKGSFFPEFFPDSSVREIGKTNYSSYLASFKEDSINCIDFKKWFLSMKGKTPYPLYAKGGIHWSKYGEILAADSMVHHLEYLSNRDLPEIVIDTIIESATNKNGDYDIGEGLNILFQTSTYPMGYPEFHLEQKEQNNTKVLFVADSYYWGMFNYGFSNSLFNDGEFWFYNHQVYPLSYEKPTTVADLDFRQKVEENDIIVLMATDANLYSFAFGFVDKLYSEYAK